jgi:ketosteroid isomerase-like protein
MESDEQAVITAAEQRATALVAGDVSELKRLMHPKMRWTTHRGDVLDRDTYVAGNTDGSLVWQEQRLEEATVTVVGDTAVLTAVVVDEVKRGGERETFRLRLTQTWVRYGGTWQCIAGHAGPRL